MSLPLILYVEGKYPCASDSWHAFPAKLKMTIFHPHGIVFCMAFRSRGIFRWTPRIATRTIIEMYDPQVFFIYFSWPFLAWILPTSLAVSFYT